MFQNLVQLLWLTGPIHQVAGMAFFLIYKWTSIVRKFHAETGDKLLGDKEFY